MKVVHICMIAYLDGWGYQDNLLPEYMSKAGHEVVVISSANHFPSFLKEAEIKRIKSKGDNYYVNNVHLYRIKTKFDTSNYNFYCSGLSKILNDEKPDVIFHHGVNSSSMLIAWNYIRKHYNVKFFIDNHADRINESSRKIWNFIITKIILGTCIKIVDNKVTKYYGVTPGRCEYLESHFGVPEKKISLLPIGGDTDLVDSITSSTTELRAKYGYPIDSKIIVSGGKMGEDKGTVSLLYAFKRLKRNDKTLSLVLFGNFSDAKTEALAKETDGVFVEGWCDRQKTIELLKLSDVACWPIHHTTLIEDAVACATPVVLRKTGNTMHLVDGNGVLIEHGGEEEIFKAFTIILYDGIYADFKKSAEIMKGKFGYHNISKQIIDDCKFAQ